MIDLSVKRVVKAFEENNNILDGISFEVYEGEHVGILGKNGAGKTTLFRLISGELEPDEGDIVMPAGKRAGILTQIPKYPPHYTGEDVLKTAHNRIYKMQRRLEELAVRMGEDDSPAVMREYDKLSAEFERLGGYELDRLRNTVANGLMIPQKQRDQLFDTLSGGEKTRLNLARLILEDTDILLLDEPTNHLDMKAAEWLEEYLVKFKGTVLAISHDRYFLDQVATRTIEVVNGKAEIYNGNYSFFVREKQRKLEEQQKQYEKQQSEIKRLEEARDRLYQWGTGNKNLMKKSFAIQSRIDRIDKVERPQTERKMRAKFSEKSFSGDEVMVIKGLSKSYDGKKLFGDVELSVRGGERIALIGDNGTGKSTMLKIIVGEERPDTGFVKIGPAIKTAYLPQVIKFKNPHRSVLDTLIMDENFQPQEARNRLGAFKFSGEDVFKPVSQLSGGEQSRLRMCILMRKDINFLILDEPTNHLDIISREWIEEAVEEYEEALLFVSHDRYFINKFATRIWEIEDGALHDFRGTFEQYREYKARMEHLKQVEKEKKAKETSRERAQKPKRQRPVSAEKQLAKVEAAIAALEEEVARIDSQMEEFSSDYEKLMELESARAETEKQLDEKMEEWERLSESVQG